MAHSQCNRVRCVAARRRQAQHAAVAAAPATSAAAPAHPATHALPAPVPPLSDTNILDSFQLVSTTLLVLLLRLLARKLHYYLHYKLWRVY